MQKILEYLPQFEEDQIHVALEGEEYLVEAQKIEETDVMLREVAIQEYDNKISSRQIINNLIQVLTGNPMFQGMLNPAAFLVRLFSLYPEISTNPEELLIKNPVVQKLLLEWQANSMRDEKTKMMPPEEAGENEGGEENPLLKTQEIPGLPEAGTNRPPPPDAQVMSMIAGQTQGL
jgi:hypothetical protein